MEEITFEEAVMLQKNCKPTANFDLRFINKIWSIMLRCCVLMGNDVYPRIVHQAGIPFIEGKDTMNGGDQYSFMNPFDNHMPFNHWVHGILPSWNQRVIDFNKVSVEGYLSFDTWLRHNAKTYLSHMQGTKANTVEWNFSTIPQDQLGYITEYTLHRQLELEKEVPSALKKNKFIRRR